MKPPTSPATLDPDRPRLVRIDALGAADGAGFAAAPASILLRFEPALGSAGREARVLAAGRSTEVARHEAHAAGRVEVVARPRAVLIPGLVNAHTHLDLTHLGPREHDPADGFVAWVDMVRAGRRADDSGIAESVEQGVRLSLAAGTVAIGDIAGAPRGRPSLVPWRTLRRLGVPGVSFLEFFGIGRTAERSAAAVHETLDAAAAEETGAAGEAVLGLQPHAPNTVSLRLYRETVSLAGVRPVCTHLAETPEEREFVAAGRGPQRELLERLGVWDDSILDEVGRGRHPVEHLAGILNERPMLVAHVNDATDAAIETLARARASVVYCPHASAYFHAERAFGPHRYRDMLRAGVNVCLGTDSIVNLPEASVRLPIPGEPLSRASGMSIWREMAMLHTRDGTDPVELLTMATGRGARALGLEPGAFTFGGRPLTGLLAVTLPDDARVEDGGPATVLGAALRAGRAPEILWSKNYSGPTGIVPALGSSKRL